MVKTKASKDSKTTYGAQGKRNLLMIDPEDLVIVTDPKSPIYDRRHNKPIDPCKVANVEEHGIEVPVKIRKNPETGDKEVVFGRQRTKWLRIANKNLVKKGQPKKLMPCVVVVAATDKALNGLMNLENSVREEETTQERAEKVVKRLELNGGDMDEAAVNFGLTKQTIKNIVAYAESTAALKKAVDTGVVTMSAAYTISKLPPTVQREKIAEISSKVKKAVTPRQKSRAVRDVVQDGPRMRTKPELTSQLAQKGSFGDMSRNGMVWDTAVRHALEFVLGMRDHLSQKAPKAVKEEREEEETEEDIRPDDDDDVELEEEEDEEVGDIAGTA